VAVVGAGFAGLAAARALAAGGARVAVLEAGRVGGGASGRTGGIVLEGSHVGPLPGLDACIDLLHRRVAELGMRCGLALTGCRELAHRPAEDDAPECGEAPEGVASRRGPVWRDGRSVLVEIDREPGGVVDPGRLVTGLARAALAAGATLHEGAAVRRLASASGQAVRRGTATPSAGPVVLETARGAVRADAVVLATNAWLPELVPELAPPPIAALTFALATEPLTPDARAALAGPGGEPLLPFYTADLPYLWGRGLDDGGIVVGSGLRVGPPARLAGHTLADAEARQALERLLGRVRGLHPALAAVCPRARWAGPVALLRERPPYLGRHPRAPRVIVAGGWSGHGVAASVAGGERVAAALLRDEPLPAWGAVAEPRPTAESALRPSTPPGTADGPGRRPR